ncbi:MAG TPA: phosphate acyltransferase PlsX [Chloroflexota bacterium]|nr:phosphate acyltransferase PlsX [Chloroflexota bacterium]
MRVALDAMGGDAAPRVTVAGAVEAAGAGLPVTLVGQEAVLRAELARYPRAAGLPLEIVDAPEVVAMDEHPASAVRRKPGSSIAVATRLVKDGQAGALYSAGNSGAVMAAALFILGRLEGVHRPAIGAVVPLVQGRCLILDIGANADCEPHNLLQFAQLGSAYMERVYGLSRPRVGLVSNGEESTKGNALVLATQPLLQASGLNFIGNVEGKDITAGAAEVVVCDGFTGNVILKLAEGMQELIFTLVRNTVKEKLHYQLAGAVLRPALRAAARRLDYTEFGGAPLIGVRGAVFIGHGRSNAKAIANGIRTAAQAASGDLLAGLQASVSPVAAPAGADGSAGAA